MDADLICQTCGGERIRTIVSRYPDGSIREATWDCGCGQAHAWYADYGTIDLGEARETDEESRELRAVWLSRLMFNPFVGWPPETRSFEEYVEAVKARG